MLNIQMIYQYFDYLQYNQNYTYKYCYRMGDDNLEGKYVIFQNVYK